MFHLRQNILTSTEEVLSSTEEVLSSTEEVLSLTEEVLSLTEVILPSTQPGLTRSRIHKLFGLRIVMLNSPKGSGQWAVGSSEFPI
ncbi:MAG: hypothetical protein SVX43_04345 [Cyanobacteriota bacterium]|nr:hypothetical protein [Cyanobacteriota bacterium]